MDTLIKNGILVDGGRIFKADLLLSGDSIKEIGASLKSADAFVFDASGLVVCPGFIDTHRHIDAALLAQVGYGEIELRQGITSAIAGNCGFSLFPYFGQNDGPLRDYLRPIVGDFPGPVSTCGAYLEKAAQAKPAINVGSMAGNGTIRVALAGFGNISADLYRQAYAAIDLALSEGAFGLSMGLMYAPENDYDHPALVGLAKAMGGRGVLAVHLRGEGRSLASSVNEAISISRESGARLVISHFKAAGCPAMGEAYNAAKTSILNAQAEGIDISIDAYPYAAGSTSILTLLPPRMLSSGVDALCKNLREAHVRAELRRVLCEHSDEYDNLLADIGYGKIRIASADLPENQHLIGRDIEAIAKERGVLGADVIADLIISERGQTTIVNFIVDEVNLDDTLAFPGTCFISDSLCGAQMPHPRYYGAFARVLRHCVREKGLMTLEEAIRRMTQLPAERYGIIKRGRLIPGYFADIIAFDPETATDNATYESPRRLASGVQYAWVNGRLALKNGQLTGALPGTPLRREI